jgi:UPF0755 protein
MAHSAKHPVLRIAATGLIPLLLAIGAVCASIAIASRPSASIPSGGVLFEIERGEGAQVLANRLESAGLLRSALSFRVLAKALGVETSIKAGTYRIMPGMGSKELLDAFVSGRQALMRVTVPEGYTMRQIASLLEADGIAVGRDFLAACVDPSFLAELGFSEPSLEGYLFPDTYLFPLDHDPRDVAREMVRAFRQQIASIPEAASLSPSELHRRVVLASIIEREYRRSDEAPLMASVFFNRLRIGMALQSCATVVYVITEKLGKPHPEMLYDRDIKIPDPYNTYTHAGLPPGPISNPGRTALEAVFRPAVSSYLYFRLVDPQTGSHHFSTSLEEHVGARSLYVKRVGG